MQCFSDYLNYLNDELIIARQTEIQGFIYRISKLVVFIKTK